MCDQCFEQVVLKQYNADCQLQLDWLNTAIHTAEAAIAKVSSLETTSEALAASAEVDLQLLSDNAEVRMSDLRRRLERVEAEGAKARASVEQLKQEIARTNASEQSTADSVRRQEGEVTRLSEELKAVEDTCGDLSDQTEYLSSNMRNSIDIATASTVFCLSCINKVCSHQSLSTLSLSLISRASESLDITNVSFASQ
jgi:chromosome segregation ATPase